MPYNWSSMSSTIINNGMFTSTQLYYNIKHSLLDSKQNATIRKNWSRFVSVWLTKWSLIDKKKKKTKNVTHVQTVSILWAQFSTLPSSHQTNRLFRRPDVTEGQNRQPQCLRDTTTNSQQPNDLQLASWGKAPFLATNSPTLPLHRPAALLVSLGFGVIRCRQVS